jgi:hypothetical protein
MFQLVRSQQVRFSCAGCRQYLQIAPAQYGHPVTCPSCSATQVVHKQAPDDEVPLRLSLPRGLGIRTTVSRETANTSVKVVTGALCAALGVVAAVLVGKLPRG